MKRLVCMVLLIVFAMSFAAAENADLSAMSDEELKTLREQIDAELLRRTYATANDSAEDGILGVWYLTEATVNGQNMDVSNTGVAMSVEFREDLTFSIVRNGMRSSGMWNQDGNRYYASGVEVILSDGRLEITEDGSTMRFSREPVDSTIPQTVAARSEDEFIGEWVLDKVGLDGVVVPAGIAPENVGTDLLITIKPGKASIDWDYLGLLMEFDTSFTDGRLVLLSGGQNDPGVRFSPVEKTNEDGLMFTMAVDDSAEPISLYMKKDPLLLNEGPIPSFGLKGGMSRRQIVSRMENQGFVLYEEDYKENNDAAEGYFAFYGKAEVFGMEATTVKVTMSPRNVDYAYYFFGEEAEFRNRLPAADTKWYRADELESVYDYLYQSLKDRFGSPGDYDWPVWKIDGTYYSLPAYSEKDQMVLLSVFH